MWPEVGIISFIECIIRYLLIQLEWRRKLKVLWKLDKNNLRLVKISTSLILFKDNIGNLLGKLSVSINLSSKVLQDWKENLILFVMKQRKFQGQNKFMFTEVGITGKLKQSLISKRYTKIIKFQSNWNLIHIYISILWMENGYLIKMNKKKKINKEFSTTKWLLNEYNDYKTKYWSIFTYFWQLKSNLICLFNWIKLLWKNWVNHSFFTKLFFLNIFFDLRR